MSKSASSSSASLVGELVRLTPPGPTDHIYEPHVAIDPADPRRVAVAAMFPVVGWRPGHGIWCWTTTDAGASWRGGRIVQPRYDGDGAADPILAYGADGALIAVGMALPKSYIDFMHARSYTRETSEHRPLDMARAMERGEFSAEFVIFLARSENDGRTWTSTEIPNSLGGDKTALAVDLGPRSPHRGRIYAAWNAWGDKWRRIAFARSLDGGRTTETAIRLGDGWPHVQLAVAPDGTLHMVWGVFEGVRNDPHAPTSILHARSEDGGATFSEPLVVARHSGPDRIGYPSLAAAADGALLVVWSEGGPPTDRWAQARHTLRWVQSRDGRQWSSPTELGDVDPSATYGLPAAAATDDAWHVLFYESTATQTSVRIWSADRDDPVFRHTRTLASRHFGAEHIYLVGNYGLRASEELAVLGEYVGLAGTGSTLAAAIALPESDDWRSQRIAYVALLRHVR